MTVHAGHVEVRGHPVAGVSRDLMLAVGLIAVMALLAVGLLVLLGSLPGGTDANIVEVERLQELRTTLGGGGFI